MHVDLGVTRAGANLQRISQIEWLVCLNVIYLWYLWNSTEIWFKKYLKTFGIGEGFFDFRTYPADWNSDFWWSGHVLKFK